jgi:hypothetical protein
MIALPPTSILARLELYAHDCIAAARRNVVALPAVVAIAACLVALGTGLFVLQSVAKGKLANAEDLRQSSKQEHRFAGNAAACAGETWPYLSDECLARPPGLVRVLPPAGAATSSSTAAMIWVEEQVERQSRSGPSAGSKMPPRSEARSASRVRLTRKASRERPAMTTPEGRDPYGWDMRSNHFQRARTAVGEWEPRRWSW